MKKENSSRYILLVVILLINIFYSYLYFIMPGIVLFSFVVFVPVAIYALKYGVDSQLTSCLIAVLTIIYLLYGVTDFISYTLLIVLPAIIIGFLIKVKASFSRSASLLSIVYFVCCLSVIIILNYIYKIDILTLYFNTIDALTMEFMNVYGSFIATNTSTTQEYSLVMQSFKNIFYFMKYYYPALLYVMCICISFVSILFVRILASKLKLFHFNPKNIINYKVPRSMIFFLIIIFCTKAFSNSYLNVAINNLLVILTLMLFLVGILFELFMITRTKSTGQRTLLIIVSLICLIFFQSYFVVVGFVDSAFQIRKKLKNT